MYLYIMKKNIRITESQLKMLMEQQEVSGMGSEPTSSIDSHSNDSTETNNDGGDNTNLETIKSNVGTLLGNGFEKEKLKEMISGLIDSYQGSSETEDNSIPPAPSHEDSMQNQIYESIRKEFNRYL